VQQKTGIINKMSHIEYYGQETIQEFNKMAKKTTTNKKTQNTTNQFESFMDKSAEVNGKVGAWMQHVAEQEAKEVQSKMSEIPNFWMGITKELMEIKAPSDMVNFNMKKAEDMQTILTSEFENNNKKVQERTQEFMKLFA
jgi:hypothetical protein